jgi:hypothetical protein
MRDAPTHTCPGPGCESRVPTEMLACREHWFQVPKALRDEVWSAWRALQRERDDPIAAEERHEVAMRAAIETMTEVRRG